MPNYWNPNNFYPVSYAQQSYAPSPMPQQSFATQPTIAAVWVDGEVEARGKSIPQGVSQFFMVDVNNQKIYWKSLNQMGMPNPMQILNFTIEGQQQNLPAGQSGTNYSGYSGDNNQSGHQDMSQFVTKQDFEQLRNEIRQMSGTANGGNNGNSGYSGSNGNSNNSGASNSTGNQSNRGGNR